MIHILTADETWSAPLEALLREKGHIPTRSADPFEAIDGARATGWGVVVVGADTDEDDVSLLLRLLDRHVGSNAQVYAVEREGERFAHTFGKYDFVAIRDAVTGAMEQRRDQAAAERAEARAQQRSAVEELAVTPLDSEELDRLLRLARHEDYFTFIGVPKNAEAELVEARVSALLARLAAEKLPQEILDERLDVVREVREALEDVRLVLTDAWAREQYHPSRRP